MFRFDVEFLKRPSLFDFSRTTVSTHVWCTAYREIDKKVFIVRFTNSRFVRDSFVIDYAAETDNTALNVKSMKASMIFLIDLLVLRVYLHPSLRKYAPLIIIHKVIIDIS